MFCTRAASTGQAQIGPDRQVVRGDMRGPFPVHAMGQRLEPAAERDPVQRAQRLRSMRAGPSRGRTRRSASADELFGPSGLGFVINEIRLWERILERICGTKI